MQRITFGFDASPRYPAAFHDFLRLRKRFFVDRLGWDLAHDGEIEMDQYDNPTASYSLVLDQGQVVGGARIMSTAASWGGHGHMLGDAMQGRLSGIPADVLDHEITTPRVWECTRLVLADELGRDARRRCLALVVDGLVDIAAGAGGDRLISFSPLPLKRMLRQLGHDVKRISRCVHYDDGRKYAVLAMPARRRARVDG